MSVAGGISDLFRACRPGGHGWRGGYIDGSGHAFAHAILLFGILIELSLGVGYIVTGRDQGVLCQCGVFLSNNWLLQIRRN